MARRDRGNSVNILHHLCGRELGGNPLPSGATAQSPLGAHRAVTRQLAVWAEESFLKHASGSYAELQHCPRSTIAVAFNPDGSLIASTHGDHTVKLVDSSTAQTLRVLEGHLRTPWVVRFNPSNPDIIASGSLDYRVNMWRASSGECLHTHNFGKPIASLAFHSNGSHVAVASGHKVYVWSYREGSASQPSVVLRTRRSLRALHFHPHGLPLLLTGEVVERKSSTSGSSSATANAGDMPDVPTSRIQTGAAPPPAVSEPIDIPGAGSRQQQQGSGPEGIAGQSAGRPVATSVGSAGVSRRARVPTASTQPQPALHVGSSGPRPELHIAHTSYRLVSLAASPPGSSPPLITRLPPSRFAVQPPQPRSSGATGAGPGWGGVHAGTPSGWVEPMLHPDGGAHSVQPPLLRHWERQWMGAPQQVAPVPVPTTMPSVSTSAPAVAQPPFPGTATAGAAAEPNRSMPWPSSTQLGGQGGQGGVPGLPPTSGSATAAPPGTTGAASALRAQLAASMHLGASQPSSSSAAGLQPQHTGHHQQQTQTQGHQADQQQQEQPQPSMMLPLPTQSLGSAYAPTWGWEVSPQASAQALASLRERHALRLEQQLPAAGGAEDDQPCSIVSITLWPFDESQPGKPLSKPLLNIPRAVLCSEMGVTISPCGRYLAVCVACDKPSQACTAWLQQQQQQEEHQQGSSQAPSLPQQESMAKEGTQGAQHVSAGSTNPAAATHIGLDTGRSSRNWQGSGQGGSAQQHQPCNPVEESTANGSSSGSGSPYTCELRIYAIWGPRFGEVLAARPIRAAHCLTSLQFSPMSEHLLVGYGRRHISLCTLLVDGASVAPVHTILEVYRVSDLQLVRVLPSLEDEINCATWSPEPGAGIAYGTKEGKLRILSHDRRAPERLALPCLDPKGGRPADDELWEAERLAGVWEGERRAGGASHCESSATEDDCGGGSAHVRQRPPRVSGRGA